MQPFVGSSGGLCSGIIIGKHWQFVTDQVHSLPKLGVLLIFGCKAQHQSIAYFAYIENFSKDEKALVERNAQLIPFFRTTAFESTFHLDGFHF